MATNLSRRGFATGALAVVGGAAFTARRQTALAINQPPSEQTAKAPDEGYRIAHGAIKQSVMGWCYKPLSAEKLIESCHRMGMPAMEGISREHYPKLRRLGMHVSIVSSHGFKVGPFSKDNHAVCLAKLREAIDVAVTFGSPNVITFTGMREKGVSDEQGARNCVECWEQAVGYAEEKGVNLCLEHLNTRDDSHPMKGHPGYFGDDVDFCAELIRRVGSPRMKLLFDIYHVQIMNGDVIRRIRQYHEIIGHYHTAGVPGRAELDDAQEINYPAVMRAILETGYTGYVAQEFIPTWGDKLAALRHGVRVCDVEARR